MWGHAAKAQIMTAVWAVFSDAIHLKANYSGYGGNLHLSGKAVFYKWDIKEGQ